MKKNPYYTHAKYLKSELELLDYSKPVRCLEFGAGHGSSPIFKRFAEENANLVVDSYEGDPTWFNKVSREYSLQNYRFHYVPSWDDLFSSYPRLEYNLVFVDQTPWEARIQTIDWLRESVKIFILHDYCYYNKGVIDDINSVGPGSFFYDKYAGDFVLDAKTDLYPPTLILRNNDYSTDS